MSIESILSDISRAGELTKKDESFATKNCQAALMLLTKGGYDKQTKAETDPETVSLLVTLFVEATRIKISDDDFASTCTDFLAKAPPAVVKIVSNCLRENRDVLQSMQSSFFVDLPHLVGISSSVQHHVRDFALTGSTNNNNKSNKIAEDGAVEDENNNNNSNIVGVLQPGFDEKPRSVANFVFSLDLASRGILSSSVGSADGNSKSGGDSELAAGGEEKQILFQCTAEQAQEFANSLRAAANAMNRVEERSK